MIVSSEDELSDAVGGTSLGEGVLKYCKYCGVYNILTYQGIKAGWDKKAKLHNCYVWKCRDWK